MNGKELLNFAQHGHYAIGSFNFSTAEVLKAIVKAAQELKSPIIVSTSEGEGEFIGLAEAAALVDAWRHGTGLPIILNLDHGKSLESIKKAIAAGYNAVHFDGSKFAYEENVAQTKAVVEHVRDWEARYNHQIVVEGELGYLRGSSSLHEEALEIKPEDLTSAEQAQDFAQRTGVDSLAVVIGNAHGVFTNSEERLNLERLAEIHNAVSDKAFLVLHGGSGISVRDIEKGIELGIVKININTELRVAYKDGLAYELGENPKETTPYKILGPSFERVKNVVAEKIRMFGSDGKA